MDTIVKGNKLVIPHFAKAPNSMNLHQKDLYVSINTQDIYNIHSGLVTYSGSESEEEENAQEVSRESLLDQPTQAVSPSALLSPTPSPTQMRRNQQAEQVLANFGSRSLLALLTESLRREESDRTMALQRVMHNAGVRPSIKIKWSPLLCMKIFDINTHKVSQKMAGYLAYQIRTWAEAKEAYNLESEGLAIFAYAAGAVNATDPFEMRKLQHELQNCLPPLQLTAAMREFATAPTPPPAVPIPFPQGLFSPLATPPPQPFRFGVRDNEAAP